jgi:drug/metabolite transporter (DMT)-like permease
VPSAASLASGLASAAAWGAGDFAGGVAARRLHVFRVVLLSQLVGLALIAASALIVGEPWPPRTDLLWSAAAGLSGAVGVTCLYASLAAGRMGVAAPITGVVAATVPVMYTWLALSPPGPVGLAGTALALLGIALVSGPRAERPPLRVLGLALLAGLGFAGFLLLMGLSGRTSFLWLLVAARAASAAALFVLVIARRPPPGPVGRAVVATGVLDAAGNALFLLAARLGALDVAVVLSSLYPVATVVLARLALKERLTPLQGWGAALMLAAIPFLALA